MAAMVVEVGGPLGPEQYFVQRTGRWRVDVTRVKHPDNHVTLKRKSCGCLKEMRETSTMNDSLVREIIAALERQEKRRSNAA